MTSTIWEGPVPGWDSRFVPIAIELIELIVSIYTVARFPKRPGLTVTDMLETTNPLVAWISGISRRFDLMMDYDDDGIPKGTVGVGEQLDACMCGRLLQYAAGSLMDLAQSILQGTTAAGSADQSGPCDRDNGDTDDDVGPTAQPCDEEDRDEPCGYSVSDLDAYRRALHRTERMITSNIALANELKYDDPRCSRLISDIRELYRERESLIRMIDELGNETGSGTDSWKMSSLSGRPAVGPGYDIHADHSGNGDAED